ncbi:uncharacterized protein LOC134238946 [Saccostrea cucullata]|uniref:uncharacterized protein LOC134238946 n=1 Tax=Saccostrea cuccullata TaxID=36930 RepID=UPI002ED094E2
MPKCSCKQHDVFSKDKDYKVHKIASNKIAAKIIKLLMDNGCITKRCVYICTSCAAYAESNFISSVQQEQDIFVNQVVTMIKTNNISDANLQKIASAIGERESGKIKTDINDNLCGQYKDVDFLKHCDIDSWVKDRDAVLTSFVTSLCGKDFDNMSSSEKTKVVYAIEHLYSIAMTNTILPFSFSLNLLSYYVSSSKTVCNLYSSAHPSGSYSSVLNWIEQHSQSSIDVPFHNDIITYFDNNQVLARNWRVRYDAKAILSTITTVVHFSLNPPYNLQNNDSFSPRLWLYQSSISDSMQKVLALVNHYEDHFRYLRENYIEGRLQILAAQRRPGLTDPEDTISILLKNEKKTKFSDKSRCQVDCYSFLEHNHKNTPNIHMGNPISVNPCSFNAIKSILEKLKTELGVPERRKWSIIGCDGLPYLLCQRVLQDNPEFQDLLVQPGLGHFEINMAKAVIKLLWEVIGVDLAKLLGYRSPKALQACLQANDHHKAMQFIEILLLGTGDELLQPYIRHCHDRTIEPSAKGFFVWCRDIMDPNYKFLLEAIFTYALAVYLFRAGVRRNNSDAIMACRVKFSSLYFGTGKTNYQRIEMTDLMMRVCAPLEVHQFLQQHETFTRKSLTIQHFKK